VTGHSDAATDRIMIVECPSEQDVTDAAARLKNMPAWMELAEPTTMIIAFYRLLYSIAK
jgi:hypothetical protein